LFRRYENSFLTSSAGGGDGDFHAQAVLPLKIVTRLRAGGWGGVRFPAGLWIFLFATASRAALGPTKLPIQWVPGKAAGAWRWPLTSIYRRGQI